MNKDRQRELLTNFCNEVRDAMLEHSDEWPEDWDGFELRWLAEMVFNLEAPAHNRMGQKRWRDFLNTWQCERLY